MPTVQTPAVEGTKAVENQEQNKILESLNKPQVKKAESLRKVSSWNNPLRKRVATSIIAGAQLFGTLTGQMHASSADVEAYMQNTHPITATVDTAHHSTPMKPDTSHQEPPHDEQKQHSPHTQHVENAIEESHGKLREDDGIERPSAEKVNTQESGDVPSYETLALNPGTALEQVVDFQLAKYLMPQYSNLNFSNFLDNTDITKALTDYKTTHADLWNRYKDKYVQELKKTNPQLQTTEEGFLNTDTSIKLLPTKDILDKIILANIDGAMIVEE